MGKIAVDSPGPGSSVERWSRSREREKEKGKRELEIAPFCTVYTLEGAWKRGGGCVEIPESRLETMRGFIRSRNARKTVKKGHFTYCSGSKPKVKKEMKTKWLKRRGNEWPRVAVANYCKSQYVVVVNIRVYRKWPYLREPEKTVFHHVARIHN